MTTIMLDIPDDLVERIQMVGVQLPHLLQQTLDGAGIPNPTVSASPVFSVSPFLQEVADFLLNSPTPAEIIAFKASAKAQARLEDLLYRNREAVLTPQERAELDSMQAANHLLILLKSRARATQPITF